MAATGKVIGTVTAVVGEVKATAADGTVRILQVGDQVYSDEVINTSAAGSINVALESGKTLDCGGDTDLALHESILGVATAASPATSAPGSDVAALQAAIAGGQDPSQVAPATAAGGAPAAGGVGGDGGSHEPVILEQSNSATVVTSGFTTEGDTIGFPTSEFELLPISPTVSISVQVQVEVEVQIDVEGPTGVTTGPAEGGVFAVSASGDAVSLLEGTMEGTMEIPFVITLSQVFDTDVTVTYQIVPNSAFIPSDFFDGQLVNTITIPAGETSFIVPIQIVRDHFVEANESFSIMLIDAVNATINAAQSSASVTIFNDDANPVANPDTNWVQEDNALHIAASGNVLDSQSHLGAPSGTFADAEDTDFEALTVTNPGTQVGTYGTLVLASDGSYTYTLNTLHADVQALDSGETLSESFSYSVTDGFNTPDTSTITISIFGDNDVPEITVLAGAEGTVHEAALAIGSNPSSNGEFVTGSFRVSDTDGVDDIDSVTINGQTVAIGSLVGATFSGSAGVITVTSYSDGVANFTYELTQAVTDGEGAETDVFTLTTSDGTNSSAPAAITITIVDDVPTAVNDGNSMTEDAVSVGGNVRDNDMQGADRTATVGAGTLEGEFGTLALGSDGGYTYTRTANLQGMDDGESVVDSFPYTLTDADGDASPAQLTITLTGLNDAPVAIDDTNSMTEDDALVSGNVIANDTDVDGETLTVVGTPITLNNSQGTLVIDPASGAYTFTLSQAGVAAAQALDDGESFAVAFADAYRNTDGDANSNLADVTITVTGLNDAPVAIDDTNSMTEDDASVSGNVIANDTDVDGETLTVVGTPITLEDEMGTLVINPENGSYIFTLTPAGVAAAQALDDNESLVVKFSDAYQNTDGDADSNLADVTITVTGVNDAMNADDDTDSFTEDEVENTVAGVTNVIANDDEIDASDLPLTVQDTDVQNVYLLDGEGNLTETVAGTITFASGGTYSLTLSDEYKAAAQVLDADESFRVGVAYTAQNSETPTAETDEAILRITIEGVNDAMIANNDAETFDEDAVTGDGPVNGLLNVLLNDEETDTSDQPLTVLDTAEQPLYLLNSDGTLNTEEVVGTISINSNGSYSFELTDEYKTIVDELNESDSLEVGVEYTAQNSETTPEMDNAILRITIAGLTDVEAQILDVKLTANTNQDEQLGVFTFVNGDNMFQSLVFFDQEGQQDPTAAFLGFDIDYAVNSNVSLKYIDAFAGESGDSTGQTSENIKVKDFVLGQDNANVDIVNQNDGVNIGISNPTKGLQGDAVVNMNDPASGSDTFQRVGDWTYTNPADNNDRVTYDGTTGTPQNGLAGIDILEVVGSSIDLTALNDAEIENFEVISLTGAAVQSLTLNAADVLEVTDDQNVLHVIGGPQDTVNLTGGGWTVVGADTSGSAGIQGEATYFGWVQFNHTSGAKLLVDPDMTVQIIA